jgi:signal transduction histidine kinase
MTLRSLLLAIGIPLVVLPLSASFLVFSSKMAEADLTENKEVLNARLELVMQQINSAWGVSARVGFAQSAFYQTTVIQSLATTNSVAGGDVVVLNDHSEIVLGPDRWKGRTIGALNPWHSLLEKDGVDVVAGPFPNSADRYLTVHRRFLPWGWTVVAFLDQAEIWKTVSRSLTLSVIAGLGFLALAIGALWYLTRRVSQPLVELQKMAIRMGQGDFDQRVKVSGPSEVASLGMEWNSMADRVQDLTRDLERRVFDRTRDLADALDRTKTMQDQLILAEKMASLGQLVAGIAHELNTPLAAMGSARSTLDDLFGEHWEDRIDALVAMGDERRKKVWSWVRKADRAPERDTAVSRRVRKDLSTRLRGAGVLEPEAVADQLAEVGLVDWSDADLAYLHGPEGRVVIDAVTSLVLVRVTVNLMGTALAKADRVISALRIYSRHDPSRDVSLVSVAHSVDSILPLFQNRLRSGMEVVRAIPAGLSVLADPDRLGQLWTNLIGNALGAMGNQGRLELWGEVQGTQVVVRVIDSGTGIALEHQPKIFTPFFTTKPPGEGSGLGLSICQTIVQEAGGTLTFVSKPGQTIFEARFPCP